MASVKIRYYVVKGGRGYWQPTKKMKAHGFASMVLGPHGPEAWAKAEQMNRKWQLARHGINASPNRKIWPSGSIGEAFERFHYTDTWARKEPRTREDWERGWRYIEPIFGEFHPATVTFQDLDAFYSAVLRKNGVSEAFRALKIWRALWVVMSAMGYCLAGADPSKGVRRLTPRPRTQTWREGEAVRLVKGAVRAGYAGLACIVAVAWDTQFAPVDVRSLSMKNLVRRGDELMFVDVARRKTDAPAIGTLSRRTQRVVAAYLNSVHAELHPQAPLFRNRSGRAYSKDTLGDDFRDVRALVFPGDERRLMDLRRSGAVEAAAGGVDPNHLAAKMANTINRSQELQRTYQPVDLASVKAADVARRAGRRRMRETQ